jgi:hypothetical protein
MIRLIVAAVLLTAATPPAFASWQSYRDDGSIVATFDLATFAPFQGKPSVWVKWQNVTPQNGIGGTKLQFTADCAAGSLYEISAIPFDAGGNYLAENRHYESPKAYPVTPGSLNKATYDLLCH